MENDEDCEIKSYKEDVKEDSKEDINNFWSLLNPFNRYYIPWYILIFGNIIMGLMLLALGLTIWKELSWKGWVAIGSISFTFVLLVSNIIPESIAMMLGLIPPLITNVITPKQAFIGFSNSGVITIALLFIVAKGLSRSGILHYVLRYILKKPKWLLTAQLRLLLPVSILSGFTNNTPIVAMMIPVVQSWSLQINKRASLLLMPLSFGTILGGTCTIIGTSTNLIVASLSEENGGPNISFFDITLVGVPNLIIGLIYMILFSKLLLPNKQNATESYLENPKEYTSAVKVTSGPLVGKTIHNAGLRSLPGIYLIEIWRQGNVEQYDDPLNIEDYELNYTEMNISGSNDYIERNIEIITAPSSDTILMKDDVLYFSGVLKDMQIIYQIDGLTPSQESQILKVPKHRHHVLVEAVIANHSSLINMTPKEIEFRTKYQAAIISIYRHGHHLNCKIANLKLKGGDVLLLETNSIFINNYENNIDFYLVSEVNSNLETVIRPKDPLEMLFMVLPYTIIIVLNIMRYISLSTGSLIMVVFYILTKRLTLEMAWKAVNLNLIIILAIGLGLGQALEVSGASEIIGQSIFPIFQTLGIYGILSGVYFITAILSSFINNAAAVTLMFPIVFNVSKTAGISLKAVLITLAIAGSASFATPIGYQTNIMVQGPGNYGWLDFFKFGFILVILNGIVTILLSALIY